VIVNRSKSKEVILGSLAKQSVPCLTVQSDVIERVTSFKLLGVTLSNDLSWEAHVNTVCAKVAPRLYYLKQLRRFFEWPIVFLSHGNQTCPRIWMCNLAPWSNCCSVPKIGIFGEEGPQNHSSHCIWYAIWFCMYIRWGRTPFCTKVWFGEKIFSHSYKCWQLFTRPSSPTTRLWYYFSTPTTYRLSHTTDEN